MAESVSKREYARRKGVDERVVRRLASRGLLPQDADGKIPVAEADLAWAQVRPGHDNKAPSAVAAVETGAEDREETPQVPPKRNEALELDLTRKSLGVRLQELRIGRESGELVPRAEVRREAAAVCGAIRSALLAMPARVSLLLEGVIASADGDVRAAQIRRLLEREIDQALEALYEFRAAPDSAGDAA